MALTKAPAELLNLDSGLTITGTTPYLVIGDAGAEDTKIVFDGNAQDYYIGLDDSADTLLIGRGATVGTTAAMTVDSSSNIGIGTASPGAPLNVTSAYSSGAITTALKLATVGGYNANAGTALDFGSDQGNYSTWLTGRIAAPRTGDNWGGSLVFSTNDNSAATGLATAMTIDHSGQVTMPKQPAFSAMVGSTQSNLATGQNVDIVFGTEIYDEGSNFASNTFTAPVAGKYQLSYFVRLDAIDTAASYYYLMIKTSNRNYSPIYAGSTFGASNPTYMSLTFSVLADMDASDTAKVTFDQTGGAGQVDVNDGYFTGILVA